MAALTRFMILLVSVLTVHSNGCQFTLNESLNLISNTQPSKNISIIDERIAIQFGIQHHSYCESSQCNILSIKNGNLSFLSLFVNGTNNQYVLNINDY